MSNKCQLNVIAQKAKGNEAEPSLDSSIGSSSAWELQLGELWVRIPLKKKQDRYTTCFKTSESTPPILRDGRG